MLGGWLLSAYETLAVSAPSYRKIELNYENFAHHVLKILLPGLCAFSTPIIHIIKILVEGIFRAMVNRLLCCVVFILGSIILAIGKECQIAELVHILACESWNCGTWRLRRNMLYRYIIIIDNSSFVRSGCTNRTISVPFDMLI